MKCLIFETSTESGFVLLSDGRTSLLHPLPRQKEQGALLSGIDKVLRSGNVSLQELDCIGVGTGPGLFTGTRIAVLTAKTLNFTHNIPLIGFCSLMPYAPSPKEEHLVLLDGRSQGLFIYDGRSCFSRSSKHPAPEERARAVSPDPDRLSGDPVRKGSVNVLSLIAELERLFLAGTHSSHRDITSIYQVPRQT
ncbi:MAG: tRNA (adenosine(37)-N6)-threonylcarbamoyltransferase complex dimerization subunit type 1 TsaB [Simkaniaceae bacterium]|nr:tRNA (adenosine(37)-N6)-threonylcarbamoyltransferase complex dimerization subunit type 1 TsaB [Simkaniaceae bacterium]